MCVNGKCEALGMYLTLHAPNKITFLKRAWKRSLICEPIARMTRPTQYECRLITERVHDVPEV